MAKKVVKSHFVLGLIVNDLLVFVPKVKDSQLRHFWPLFGPGSAIWAQFEGFTEKHFLAINYKSKKPPTRKFKTGIMRAMRRLRSLKGRKK